MRDTAAKALRRHRASLTVPRQVLKPAVHRRKAGNGAKPRVSYTRSTTTKTSSAWDRFAMDSIRIHIAFSDAERQVSFITLMTKDAAP